MRCLGVHWAQIDVPAPLGDVVRVTDVVSRTRPFTANFTNLCHEVLQKIPDVRGETPIIPAVVRDRQTRGEPLLTRHACDECGVGVPKWHSRRLYLGRAVELLRDLMRIPRAEGYDLL